MTNHPRPSAKNAEGETRRASSKFQFEEGQPALDNFKRTMTALFRVPKSEVQNSAPKPTTHRKAMKAKI
jgi:hypothetical protein